MSLSLWYYRRLDDGTFLALTGKAWKAFLYDGEALSGVHGEFVYTAEIVVKLEKRRPREIYRMVFSKMRLLADGRQDREHQLEALRAMMESIALPLDAPPAGVVNASHRFARRQSEHMSRWTPTVAEQRTLAAAVNQRAGSKLL